MSQNKRINALQFQRADAEIYQYRTISIRRWINQSRGSNLIDVLVKYTSDFAMETSTVVCRVFLKRIILLSFGSCLIQR